ncbi:MAG: hypothetical protein ACOCWY_06780, partial [Thermodesulfobacteriota bacterium]
TYDTSGTTGHAVAVPTHPRVLSQVLSMMTYVMARYGITLDPGPEMTACINVGALPHDIYVEILDPHDQPLPPGETGEIAVTGGRNPYLPLLRYRTGDLGSIDIDPCPCGEPTPRIRLMDGRKPVLFHSESGAPVNPIDVGRLLRGVAFVQYRIERNR